MRGQSHTDIGDQGFRAGRAFLDQVQRFVAVQDAEVRGVADAVDQFAQQRPGQPLQWVVAQVGRAEFEGGDAEAVAAFGGQMGDETGRGQFVEQVICRRPGQFEVARDGRGRDRARVAA